MTWRGHTAAPRLGLDIAIAGRAGHAVAAGTQQHGRSAHTARAWIETLHVKPTSVLNAISAARGSNQLVAQHRLCAHALYP